MFFSVNYLAVSKLTVSYPQTDNTPADEEDEADDLQKSPKFFIEMLSGFGVCLKCFNYSALFSQKAHHSHQTDEDDKQSGTESKAFQDSMLAPKATAHEQVADPAEKRRKRPQQTAKFMISKMYDEMAFAKEWAEDVCQETTGIQTAVAALQ